MPIRYEPTVAVRQDVNGRYMTFAEHEALVTELLESLEEFFAQVERGELTSSDALQTVRAFIRIRG